MATCKPGIRKHARVGDWVVGTGSGGAGVRRAGCLVYAMRVTETLETAEYWEDVRFQCKKPEMRYNWVAASGDNIYEPIGASKWRQLNSYHSKRDGTPNDQHKRRDTKVERIVVSEDYVYYGGRVRSCRRDSSPGAAWICVMPVKTIDACGTRR